MNKKLVKIAVGVSCLALAFGMAMPALADTAHNDSANGGAYCSILPWQWSDQGEYAHFYCDAQEHHATAIEISGATTYESKDM